MRLSGKVLVTIGWEIKEPYYGWVGEKRLLINYKMATIKKSLFLLSHIY